jgi:UDP-N-acetylglucosamine--N-acetylmuramyl-(pentapeptide) pyrophosphoryl-undecaprenol N-acetylglucosamine transferase
VSKKVIISGGGTGGHIFPAVSIANALKRMDPAIEILFVGAKGRMEMEQVPAAGYQIIGLDIRGFQRKELLANLSLPFKILASLIKARSIIKSFKPNVAIGVGGYASGPLLYTAGLMNVPYVIQEQNSYAGMTNKKLGQGARMVFVAFEGMDKFFPSDRIMLTGNPIRTNAVNISGKREEGLRSFGLSADKKTILVTGGSLGARTLNNSMMAGLGELVAADVQVIWQTGKHYYQSIVEQIGDNKHPNICVREFLSQMDLAYAAADLIISRAGAGTIAELCVIGKPVILVPSPNVAEDHQTKNAAALVKNNAAVLVSDLEAGAQLVSTALALLQNERQLVELGNNISKLALANADEVIANEVLKLIDKG